MSKFINAVEAKLLGQRMYDLQPLTVSIGTKYDLDTLIAYNISLEYGFRVYCKSEELSVNREAVMRSLRADIYDELIPLTEELYVSVQNQDRQKSLDLVNKILDEIHGRK